MATTIDATTAAPPAVLDAFCQAFNARDIDRVTALLLENVELEFPGLHTDYGVEAGRIPGLTGVWVGDEKLAAIGVRISRWVTMHGFAFNATTELDYFGLIIPCGIADHGVTSLEKLLGRGIDLAELAGRAAHHFGEVFGRRMIAGRSAVE